MPLTAAALGASPTTLFPDIPEARDLIKFIGYTSGVAAEVKADSKAVANEIEQAEKELLHHSHV